MRRRPWLIGLIVFAGAGCATAAPDAPLGPPVAARPLVRDDAGAVVSRLVMPPGAKAVTVQLVEENGLLLTDALRVNGQPVGLVAIDTGAGLTAIDRDAAAALGLAPDKRLPTTRRDVEPPDGLYAIRSLAVGELTIENHAIVVADLSTLRRPDLRTIVGVIGGDVLGAVPFTIDYGKRTLTLHGRDTFRPPSSRAVQARRMILRGSSSPSTAYDRANPHAGAPAVRVAINDVPAEAMLDTGFVGSVVLMPKFAAAHPEWVVRADRPAARVAGAGGALGLGGRDLAAARVEKLRALGVTFTGIRTGLALQGELDRVTDDAVVGQTVLSRFRLTFDYATRRVWADYQPRGRS